MNELLKDKKLEPQVREGAPETDRDELFSMPEQGEVSCSPEFPDGCVFPK